MPAMPSRPESTGSVPAPCCSGSQHDVVISEVEDILRGKFAFAENLDIAELLQQLQPVIPDPGPGGKARKAAFECYAPAEFPFFSAKATS